MTHYSETNRKLGDKEIAAILRASGAWTDAALGARYGVSYQTVRAHRERRSKSALRVARRLGLAGPPKPEPVQTLVKR